MSRETNVFISLGANLGDKSASLALARRKVKRLERTGIEAASSERITEPVGLLGQPEFLNQVLRLSTELVPQDLLERLQAIERAMGRVRTVRWGPRVIDIDILFYGRRRMDTEKLVLPHPEIWRRPFFQELIAELDSRFLHGWDEYGREEA